MRGHAKQNGTTLIEVLIALLLLSLGLLGLVAVNGRTLQTTVDSENRGNAALLANEIVTSLWNLRSGPSSAGLNAAQQAAVQTVFNNWQSITSRALPANIAPTVTGPDTNGAVKILIQWQAPGQQSSGQTLTSQYFTTVAIP